jgi:hypothetical protein
MYKRNGQALRRQIAPLLRDARKAAMTAHQRRCEDVGLERLTYRLLTEAGGRPGTTFDDWLQNSFFEQQDAEHQVGQRPGQGADAGKG